jgi:hypothetical protein
MSRRPRPAAPATPAPPGGTGSIYGGAIDLKPGVVLGPPVAVPTPKETGVQLGAGQTSFGVDFVLSKLNAALSEHDPDLLDRYKDNLDRYALRIRVNGLINYTERKNFVLAGTQRKNMFDSTFATGSTNLGELLDRDEHPTSGFLGVGEIENGYQCGSPTSSWYQVSYLLKADYAPGDLKKSLGRLASTTPGGLADPLADPATLVDVATGFFGQPADDATGVSIRGDGGAWSNLGSKYVIEDDGKKYSWRLDGGSEIVDGTTGLRKLTAIVYRVSS